MGEFLEYWVTLFFLPIIFGVLIAACFTRRKILVGCTTILALLATFQGIEDGNARIGIALGIIFILPLIISIIKPAKKTPKTRREKTKREIEEAKKDIKDFLKRGIITLLIGVALCVISLFMYENYSSNIKGTLVNVKGRVVNISDSWDSNTSTTDYIYTVEYEYGGKTYTTKIDGTSFGKEGDYVSLEISPESPEKGSYKHYESGVLWIGLFVAALGVIELWLAVKRRMEISSMKLNKESFVNILNKLRNRSKDG